MTVMAVVWPSRVSLGESSSGDIGAGHKNHLVGRSSTYINLEQPSAPRVTRSRPGSLRLLPGVLKDTALGHIRRHIYKELHLASLLVLAILK